MKYKNHSISTNFRLEPLRIEEFMPYFKLGDEELQKLSAKWIVADTKPGIPCRVSLADAEVGERVLAIPFVHHDVPSPYIEPRDLFSCVKSPNDVHWKKWTRDSPKWRIEAWEEDALV